MNLFLALRMVAISGVARNLDMGVLGAHGKMLDRKPHPLDRIRTQCCTTACVRARVYDILAARASPAHIA